ncbi:cation:proton antiporter [Natronorarus salvus]|uniref:cation:proton antiporter n=1 Tax=Natronorarus salvus TaxID=3117733 RepID=UPI002F26A13E
MSRPALLAVPEIPIDEPVFVFTLAIAAFLIGPLVVKRLGQPGIVGVVLLGAALGPGGTGLVEHGSAIVLLGEVGLIYLLFTVGLELDLRGFSEDPEGAAIFGLTSFFLPLSVGTAAGVVVLGLDLWAALLLAAVFASHTLLAYPIVNQYGITQNPAVTAVFGGILFTDTLALVVLAIVVGAIDGGLTPILFAEIFLSIAILFAATWFLAPPLARWFFQNTSEESYFEFLLVVALFFAAASLAELLDIAPILGAFVAGLALNRLIPGGGTLRTRIEFVGNALFIPFFLVHVGMLVDFGVILDGLATLQVAATIIAVMIAMKYVAAWTVSRIQGYDKNERGVIFGLSTGQAAAALAITLIGFEEGLFTEAVLNAVVLMLLVTAVVSPWLTERAGQRLALGQEVEFGGGAAMDPRILLPLSQHADLQRRLLEFAFVLKGEERDEPVHLLTVVRPNAGGPTESVLAETQEKLEGITAVGSEAEVPVDAQTRINHNPASGIVQSALEVQANLILMGWDAGRSMSQRMFGGVIDQVLATTRLPVLVARLGHPINTTKRLFVVVPSGIDHHEGFFETVHLVKKLADRLGVSLTVLTVEGDPENYDELFELVEPEASATFSQLAGWGELLPTLSEAAEPDDLIAVLSSRPGEVGWHNELRNLPGRLRELPPESFVMLYPREGDPEYDRQFLRFD